MSQLTILKSLTEDVPNLSDEVRQFYLDNASDIICDLRDTDVVEPKYLTTQIKMAIEMISKIGAEGQLAHTENGISRTYQSADISNDIISRITPVAKTPYSTTMVVI